MHGIGWAEWAEAGWVGGSDYINLLVFGIKSGSEFSNEDLLPNFYIHRRFFVFR